ncbi:hypothetical protein B0H19DRAFT_1123103 [Mycena capillaripes]|nr:hypothetical protein B0H19DRAFT_1123103 [Mycena capillaripes]
MRVVIPKSRPPAGYEREHGEGGWTDVGGQLEMCMGSRCAAADVGVRESPSLAGDEDGGESTAAADEPKRLDARALGAVLVSLSSRRWMLARLARTSSRPVVSVLRGHPHPPCFARSLPSLLPFVPSMPDARAPQDLSCPCRPSSTRTTVLRVTASTL